MPSLAGGFSNALVIFCIFYSIEGGLYVSERQRREAYAEK